MYVCIHAFRLPYFPSFFTSHLADLEIISLASTTTQDTDNSQPAASIMAPSNEPLSQREYQNPFQSFDIPNLPTVKSLQRAWLTSTNYV